MKEVKKTFRPEFINRIDEIIVFHKLTDEEINKIIDIMLKEVVKRLDNQKIKVELDGKRILSKPMCKEDNLISIRELIKDKIGCPFTFLDQDENPVDKSDEGDWKLEDINKEKIIKLKSEGEKNSGNNIKIFLDKKNICSINSSKTENLDKARKLIKGQYKEHFLFLDTEGNEIDENDEKDYPLEDILTNEIVKIKLKDSAPPTPLNNENTNNAELNNQNEKKENSKNKKIKIKDFSKYEIITKRKDLITYKYSNLERVENKDHPLVFQYFYDKYDVKDYTDAYIVLFCGKTGDGKSTAINAFFNIVKGIELHDDYRFILITEPKKTTGQAESQTDGIHLYYLKDYNNKPIIIIDSQGYGDTRGKKYDEMINDAFKYVFSEVIDHINTVCFISKANTNRLDILTRYIFSSVTSLFSEDISENFIVTATFATRTTIDEGPDFVESIQTDADFLKIQDRKNENEKWWYAFDSRSVLDNEEDRVTKYSREQLKALYEEKIKKLRPKNVKKCAEVLETRKQLKVQVNLLSDSYENLVMEQFNLHEKEKVINEISLKIKDMEVRINNFERDAQTLNPKELEKRMEELNKELNAKLNDLNNETETEYISSCEYDGDYYYTHCNICERNCHDYCDCVGNSLGRCTKFTWGIIGDKICEECKCSKDSHKIDKYHWIKKQVNKKKDNARKIKEEKERNEKEKNRYLEELNRKKNAKTNFDRQINELNMNKNELKQQKENNINEKYQIQEKIKNTQNIITFIIVKLKSISNKINDIAMNNNHLKTEEEYIDSLEDNIKEVGFKDEEQKKLLEQQKNCIRIFKETNNLNEKEIMNLNDSQLAEKLKIIIPKSKKDSKL